MAGSPGEFLLRRVTLMPKSRLKGGCIKFQEQSLRKSCSIPQMKRKFLTACTGFTEFPGEFIRCSLSLTPGLFHKSKISSLVESQTNISWKLLHSFKISPTLYKWRKKVYFPINSMTSHWINRNKFHRERSPSDFSHHIRNKTNNKSIHHLFLPS